MFCAGLGLLSQSAETRAAMCSKAFKIDHLSTKGFEFLQHLSFSASRVAREYPKVPLCPEQGRAPLAKGLVAAVEKFCLISSRLQEPGHTSRTHSTPPAVQSDLLFHSLGPLVYRIDELRQFDGSELDSLSGGNSLALAFVQRSYFFPFPIGEERKMNCTRDMSFRKFRRRTDIDQKRIRE